MRPKLINEHIYHIFTKSIEGFRIFRSPLDYERMKGLLQFYRLQKLPIRYSTFLKLKDKERFFERYYAGKDYWVDIIAYCLMPTHLHLILSQLNNNGISIFMGNVLNSYTRYFNSKYKRKGPLWQSRFRGVLIETEEQLHHLTRYIHLNPVSDNLVQNPEDWKFSSYLEFINKKPLKERLCSYDKYISIDEKYKDFVLARKEYQRELAKIKHLCLE